MQGSIRIVAKVLRLRAHLVNPRPSRQDHEPEVANSGKGVIALLEIRAVDKIAGTGCEKVIRLDFDRVEEEPYNLRQNRVDKKHEKGRRTAPRRLRWLRFRLPNDRR